MFPRLLRTPTLKNSGSTARDHLASERTFLAWLRTGLGFIALGIAVERFSKFELAPLPPPSPPSFPTTTHADSKSTSDGGKHEKDQNTESLVLALLTTGSGSIVYGTARYFSTMRLLQKYRSPST